MIKKLLPDFEEFQKKRIGTELFQINTLHCAKNEVFHSGFIQQIWPNPQVAADLFTFTEKILNGKIHFMCSVNSNIISVTSFTANMINTDAWKNMHWADHQSMQTARTRYSRDMSIAGFSYINNLNLIWSWRYTLGVLTFAGIYFRESKKLYFVGLHFVNWRNCDFSRVLIFANWSYFEFSRELIFAVADF